MGAIPNWLLTHSCSVEPFQGTTGDGVELFGAAVDVPRCFVDESRRRVAGNGQNGVGDYVISNTTVYAPIELETSTMTPGSRLTTSTGRVTRVIDVKRRDGGGLPTPDHVEIVCE